MLNDVIVNKEEGTVKKNIKFDDPFNKIIHDFLVKYHGYKNPLVEREVEILKALEPYDIAPKVIEYDETSFTMSYCGEPLINEVDWFLNELPKLGDKFIKDQVDNILSVLKKVGVVHRDIYNENIVIDSNGKIRLVDFGIAGYKGVMGLFDFNYDASDRFDFIFCARHTDEVLRHIYSPIDFTAMKKNLMMGLMDKLPRSKGEEGAHIHSNIIYHGLPFADINSLFKCHRPFSDIRIMKFIENSPIKCSTGIDLGCSVGANSFLLRRFGIKMTGVDHDRQSIEFAQEVNKIKNYDVNFVHADINEKFIEALPPFDMAVWVSAWMWVAKVHGPIRAEAMLLNLSRKVKVLLFDTAQGGTDKASSYQLNGRDEVEALLRKHTVYKNIIDLGHSEDGYHKRNVFLCY
jgi:hypothetical protein